MLKKHTTLIYTLCLVVLLAALIGLPASRVFALRRTALRLKQDARALWQAGLGRDEALPLAEVRAVRGDLEALERDLRAWRAMLGGIGGVMARQTWWPWLAAVGTLLSNGLLAADDLTTSAWWALLSVESALENDGSVNTASGVAIRMEADPVQTALEALGKDRERLLRAHEALQRIMPAAQKVLGSRLERSAWGQYVAIAPLAADALLIAPHLPGGTEERTWLILIQNSDELRPTGGFISSVVALTMRGHRMVSWRYMNSYDVEAYHAPHPPPPAPLREQMGAAVLLFRDANWSPDYPTSAEVLAALYQMDMGEEVAGVIAIDSYFAQLLLAALGPIPVPQYNATVTADNIIETVVAFWERPLDAPSIEERHQKHGEWLEHRKDFGRALIEAGLQRLSNPSAATLLRLGWMIGESIRGKHLLIWPIDAPQLQEDLRRMGMDGGVRSASGDYLLVVDANMGWNKADRNIARSVDYRVTLGPEGPRAHLCLSYHNASTVQRSECLHRSQYEDTYEALTQQCYWNYVRALVPQGSALLKVSGAADVDTTVEAGRTSLGALLVVPPGETRSLCLEYTLPADVVQGRDGKQVYRLTLQKQAGIAARALHVQLALPEGSAPADAARDWDVRGNQASWEGSLESDLTLELTWVPRR